MMNCKLNGTIAVLAVVFSIIQPVHATVTITRTGGTGTATATSVQDANGKWVVSITNALPSTVLFYSIRGNASDIISLIDVDIDNEGVISLDIGPALSGTGIADIEQLDRSSGQGQLRVTRLLVNGNLGLSGLTRRVRANILTFLRVGGHCYANMSTFPTPGSTLSRIDDVQIAGNCSGDIYNIDGTIDSISIGGDLRGIAPNFISVYGSSGVSNLACSSASRVRFFDEGGGMPPNPSITNLIISGDFTDSELKATTVNNVRIEGNVQGLINILSALPGPVTNTPLRVGGSLLAGGEIRLPANGLTSQIVINNNNAGGVWQGAVTVGAVGLSGPTYPNTAASLGGGSIGLVGFTNHGTDSTPINGSNVPVVSTPTSSNPIRVRHYGPVAFTGLPVMIERRPQTTAPGGAWIGVTDCFGAALDANPNILRVTLIDPLPATAWTLSSRTAGSIGSGQSRTREPPTVSNARGLPQQHHRASRTIHTALRSAPHACTTATVTIASGSPTPA